MNFCFPQITGIFSTDPSQEHAQYNTYLYVMFNQKPSFKLPQPCRCPNIGSPVETTGPDKKGTNEWCRITRVAAPESTNQPISIGNLYMTHCHPDPGV